MASTRPPAPMSRCADRRGSLLASAALLMLAAPSLAEPLVVTPDLARLAMDVRFLSDDALEGRAVGSPGIEVAAAYHEAAFRALGLEPWLPEGYRQRFTLRAAQPDAAGTLEIAAGDRRVALDRPRRMVVVTRDPAAREVTGDLVYAGYFIDAPEQGWDDLKGLDVRGRVLLVEAGEPDARPGGLFDGPDLTWHGRWVHKFDRAARLGAAGILIVHDEAGAGYGWDVVKTGWSREDLFTADDPTAHLGFMGWMTGDAAREVLAATGHDREALRTAAGERAFRPVALGGTATVRQAPAFREVQASNVVGVLRATSARARDRTIVVSAHFDHIGALPAPSDDQGPAPTDRVFNGAVDNGSASAALLELARVLAPLRDRLNANVVFLAATAEEAGLLGSTWFVRHLPVPTEQVLANVNFEMTNVWGRTKDVYAIGARHSDLEEVGRRAAASLGLTLIPERDGEKGFAFRSDQLSFHRAGIPGAWLHEGLVPAPGNRLDVAAKRGDYEKNHYHHVSDEVRSDWDLSGTAQMVEWAAAIVDELGRRREPVRFSPESPFVRRP